MPTASLIQLPNEVLLVLLEFLTDASLNALTQTCHRFHYSLEHSLYVRNARERNSSALQWAARYGVVSTVRKALAAGADPNSKRKRPHNPHPDNFLDDIYRPTPLKDVPFTNSLTLAVTFGRPDIASLLIEAGAVADISAGGAPLVAAIETNRLDLTRLLTATRDINIDSELYLHIGCNLLSIAVNHASEEIVCHLLAILDQPDNFSSRFSTPLIVAIQRMRVNLIPVLLSSAKIDPNKVDRDGRTPFMWAVTGAPANPIAVELLLSCERVDVNAVDSAGRTAIFLAAEDGNERMVRHLLATPKVDPNLADNEGMQPVARALQQEHRSVVEMFMASDRVRAHTGTLFRLACEHTFTGMIKSLLRLDKAEQSTTDADGNTWLHAAAACGRTDIVSLLLKQEHANINCQRLDGATPLICAIEKLQTATITALLHAGADVNIATTDGRTALFYAAGSNSEALTIALLERGSNVGAVTDIGESALHHACRIGKAAVVQVLLDHGADPLLLTNNGSTPLHVACANRWEQIVQLLLHVVPPLHSVLSSGWTPLLDACQAGHMNIARRLIEHGADPLARHHTGTTPLECACDGHPLMVRMLLERGANPRQMSSTGVSLLYLAVEDYHPRIAALLLQHGADPNLAELNGSTAFLEAACQVDDTLVRMLLRYGGDVTSTNPDGSTALHEVCQADYEFSSHVVIKALLDSGADINARTLEGFTPLHLACLNRRNVHLMPLVEYGADPLAEHVDAATLRRTTAVHMACFFPTDTDNLEFLVRRGTFNVPFADLWTSGWTPLHEAATAAHSAAVKFLLKRGMSPAAVAENGRTALHEVFSNGQLNIPESQKHVGEVIIALLETGKIEINHRDNEGKTVLGLAGTAPEPLRTLLMKWGAKE